MAADVMVKALQAPDWDEGMDNGSARVNNGGSARFNKLDRDGFNPDMKHSGVTMTTQHMAQPMEDDGWYNKLQGRFDNKDYYKPT